MLHVFVQLQSEVVATKCTFAAAAGKARSAAILQSCEILNVFSERHAIDEQGGYPSSPSACSI